MSDHICTNLPAKSSKQSQWSVTSAMTTPLVRRLIRHGQTLHVPFQHGPLSNQNPQAMYNN